jgi:hypothetical protein
MVKAYLTIKDHEDRAISDFHKGRITKDQALDRIRFAQQQQTAALIKLTVKGVMQAQKNALATN